MSPIIPPYCSPRSRDATGAILDGLDVEHRPEWLPAGGLTHCNQAAKAACDALDVPLPVMLANDLFYWLGTDEGRAHGWQECSLSGAANDADCGHPVLALLQEPKHGHVAVVRGIDTDGSLLVWQAGVSNHNCARIRVCFTAEQLTRTRYFSHA